ncbi:hypothetical protein Misp06_00035 [Microbulbifer sp. NBRC 101763]|uniref:hypothetical protein n=1 Tax=unclassified Microbulbifer TaxID=2619833 RepID=UPI00309F9D40
MDLKELGKETDSEYDREHTCDENPFPNEYRFVHCVACEDEAQDTWQFQKFNFADAKEVEIGESEYIREFTYFSMVVVYYCPFCGDKLN